MKSAHGSGSYRCKHGERLLDRQTGHFVLQIGSSGSKPPTWIFEDYDKDVKTIHLRLATKEAKARMSLPTIQELRAGGLAPIPAIDKVEIEFVEIPKRLRAVSPDKVSALAESMRELGLQQPISLALEEDDTGQRLILVAGLHRLKAARKLGWDKIPAVFVEATLDESDRRLWEIDENLCRADLTNTERAEHTAKRAEIIQQRTRINAQFEQKIGPGRPSTGQAEFVAETAIKTGRSKASVRRDKARGEKIAPDVIDGLKEMDPRGIDLDVMASLNHDEQREALEAVQSGEMGFMDVIEGYNLIARYLVGPEIAGRFLELNLGGKLELAELGKRAEKAGLVAEDQIAKVLDIYESDQNHDLKAATGEVRQEIKFNEGTRKDYKHQSDADKPEDFADFIFGLGLPHRKLNRLRQYLTEIQIGCGGSNSSCKLKRIEAAFKKRELLEPDASDDEIIEIAAAEEPS